ncbi:hypothetical protein [Cognataquiflexum aquatile]|uniref:hypothetical protein n=1 Tax=Cognataquiflexum aquatile TaxID=2249427 RepID=UPI000DEA07A6|nr:hypothetical protein [Cognataquiflexum aquatile]
MKKLSLEILRLSSDEVLQRSQMKKITGGYGAWVCRCGNYPPITVWDGGDASEICPRVYNVGWGTCTGV